MDILTNLKKNIISWYPIEKGQTVLQIGQDEQIYNELKNKTDNVTVVQENELTNISNKYDYVVLIGIFEKIEKESEIIEILNFAKDVISDDGKILLAFDNKFGMKYWTGIKEDLQNQYDTLIGKTEKLSLSKVKNILERLSLKYKVYYPLPNYKMTNVIFTDSYLPNDESILTRDLICFDDEEYCEFNERLAYIELLKENTEYFKFFANSYFFEIANIEIKNEIKYVNFEIYRNDLYNIKTIMKEDYIYKTPNSDVAKAHIETIKNNINILNKNNIRTLDSYDNNQIISKYAKGGIPLEEYMLDAYRKKGKEFVVSLIEKFKTEILDVFEIIDTPPNTVFDKYGIDNVSDLKMNYVKDGLIDLRAQNCFVIDNEFYIYDQEWYEENVPIEFMLYRFIKYNQVPIAHDELYQKYELQNYIDIFEKLDACIFNQIRNYDIMLSHTRSLDRIGRKNQEIKNLIEQKKLTEDHIRNLENSYNNQIQNKKQELQNKEQELQNKNNELQNKEQELQNKNNELQSKEQELQNSKKLLTKFESDIKDYKKGMEDLTNIIHDKDAEIVNYANQLRTISNSFSWKITKPIRMASWMLNPFNGASFIDRIYPPGGKRRLKYDKKQYQKYLDKIAKSYYRYVDKEVAKEWSILTERIKNEKLNRKYETDYELWMKNNDPTDEELAIQRKHRFKYRPKISVVIPLYNTPIEFFKELLFFMINQTYTNWELCLADGSPEPLEDIKNLCSKDKRIKYKFLGQNKGISENTNEAIKMVTGDFVGLLDHDDLLARNALYEVVKCINEDKNVDFVYSDEDKIQTIDEPRYMPHFKPDFAPDTLRANNYICHFSVVKKSLLDEVGYFNHEFDGAQDFDLILRITEKAKKIVHIPKILYHWRVHKQSTAMSAEAKPYAFEAGKKAVAAHLDRIGLKGKVSHGATMGTYVVDYDIIGNPKVTILIPNKDEIKTLEVCLNSILEKTTYKNYEIVIIENNSEKSETFEYYKKLEKNPKIKVIKYNEKGFNYSKIINFGVRNTDGDFIIQLNNDTELLTPNWLEKMIGFAQREDVGAVGVRLYYPDNTVQHAGIIVGALMVAAHVFRNLPKDNLGYFGRERLVQNMNAVTAACIMTKREVFEQVGFMNEEFAVAFNDIDFCLRIRNLGKLIVYNPFVEFIHYESKSRGNDNDPDKVERFKGEINLFLDTWKEKLKQGDEYYNKNLSLNSDQYAIRTEKVD